ncbi:Uncharacterised protein [Dermacoccus nishinomiyaensis]|nr:Uncharacterised protein [Dermacoccus nishinomiyaensis]
MTLTFAQLAQFSLGAVLIILWLCQLRLAPW